MAIKATMRYVSVTQPGAPDVMHVADGPVPSPRRDEVLIEVGYAGVNRPDCAQRAGTYPPPPDASPVLGLEVAGRIVARGADVTSWNIGDDVCALAPGGGAAAGTPSASARTWRRAALRTPTRRTPRQDRIAPAARRRAHSRRRYR